MKYSRTYDENTTEIRKLEDDISDKNIKIKHLN